jgi:hypothetical protein
MKSFHDGSSAAVCLVAIMAAIAGIAAVDAAPPSGALPDRVTFASADGHTTLVGYVFKPEAPQSARMPAVVMMHGRAGAYSSLAKGRYDATTLSKRHQQWGHIWAQQGYLAILVDGFGPRGYPHGFPRFSYDTRPGAPARRLWRAGLFAEPGRRRRRSRGIAGMVEWRQRHARGPGPNGARHQFSNTGQRLSGRTGILSRVRIEGTVRRRNSNLRSRARVPRLGRPGGIAAALRRTGR